MKKSLALAACAAISISFAACGDDDDDAAGDTTAATVAVATESPAEAGTEAPAGATDTAATDTAATGTAATDGAATQPPVSLTGDDAELLADCNVMQSAFAASPDITTPEVGDELTDEYRDFANEQIQLLDDLDLQTDEAKDARDALLDAVRASLEEDTYTEPSIPEDLTTFGQHCAELLAAG